MSDEDKKALRIKILDRGEHWKLPTKSADGKDQWEVKKDGQIVITTDPPKRKSKKSSNPTLLVTTVDEVAVARH